MLQWIRERLTGWVALIIILVIGLVLTISFGSMGSSVLPTDFAAKVNGEDIPATEFQQVLSNQERQWQSAYRDEIPDVLRQQLAEGVIESMVRNRLLFQYAESNGYRVSDQTLAEFIRSTPAFQLGGEFSTQSYEALLASQGMSPTTYEFEQRSALEVRQLQEGIIGSAFFTPTDFRRFIVLENERRSVIYAVFETDDYLDGLVVADEEVDAYYQDNQTLFETQETVDLEYIEIRLDKIAESVSVDGDEVRAYYDEDAGRFSSQEERRARHILISVDDDTDEAQAETLARGLRQRLLAGAEFDVVAAEYSDDLGSVSDGGDLGWVSPDDYGQEFGDALFALDLGALSEPVRTESGYHVIRLDDVREGSEKTFADVRGELTQELKLRKAEEIYYGQMERLDDLALESVDGLAGVADEMDLELRKADGFSRAGGLPLGFQANLISTVFSLEVLEDGENSPVMELEEGHAAVVHVVNHSLPEVLPLDRVSGAVEETLKRDAAAALARDAGAEFLAGLQGGVEFAAMAVDRDIEPVEISLLERSSTEVPADLLAAVFGAPKPAANSPSLSSVELSTGGFAIFEILETVPGKPEDLPREQRDGRKELLARQTGESQAASVVADLRKQADVVVADDLLDRQDVL